MRTVFRAQLDQCVHDLAGMCDLAVTAMRGATEALLAGDLRSAERVISENVQLDRARSRCEDRAYSLLARQAPVAGHLRVVLAAVHAADTIERMGDLAAHVAATAVDVSRPRASSRHPSSSS
jgi:phosphate transport system protein